MSNLQYRLTEVDGGTLMTFRHTAFGLIPDDHRKGLPKDGIICTNRYGSARKPPDQTVNSNQQGSTRRVD